MSGRKTYTQHEIDHAKQTMSDQLRAYFGLLSAASGKKAGEALDSFEPLFFNHLLLALDRPFVERLRQVTGKDGNPLNEVEVLCESLMYNDGVLEESREIKLIPGKSVLGLQFGERIRLTADQFEELSAAFFTELEHRFT